MIDSNRYKSHSEGSTGNFHEPVQAVLHSVQGQILGNVAEDIPRSDELLAHPQRGGNSEILQWMESTIIQTLNQNDQGIPCQKEGCNQGRSPSSFYQQAPANPLPQEGKNNKKKNWRKPYSPIYRIPKIQKDAMDNVFNMARAWMDIKDKEEQIMGQPHFPKK
ncbi:hypothetical protein O181_076297 [Austropuccinia psidii MF-1]|uniref:Uncharacterized protein n=1 Tax=Austropuccinia psidii MF-1 TaxID=1389203 RepID=A0A9Q3FGL4_9BASI|nr:hypothetical protein [Austropuccinia psidii MF-1]